MLRTAERYNRVKRVKVEPRIDGMTRSETCNHYHKKIILIARQLSERLPPGAADTLRPTTQSVAPQMFAAERRVVIPINQFVVGEDDFEVEVREVLR